MTKYDINLFVKPVDYNKQFIELRQINAYPTSSSVTSVHIYSVTASTTDWTSSYYGITAFPYFVIVLPEVYDNVLQGFTQLNLNILSVSGAFLYDFAEYGIATYSGSGNLSLILDDKYLLNKERDKYINVARLFEASTSITSSLTSNTVGKINSNFIDYEKGIIIISAIGLTANSINYSSAVRISDNQFICVAKSNEFNRTTNPSAMMPSGTAYVPEFNNTYVTGIGIYDDNENLLIVAKLHRPLKKSKKIDTIFKIQVDI